MSVTAQIPAGNIGDVPQTPGMLVLGGRMAQCPVCGWIGVPTSVRGKVSPVCPRCNASEVDAEYERSKLYAPAANASAALGLRVAAPAKVARNAPCPCGSGKKAKKCCHA